jgi:hypothetical protein
MKSILYVGIIAALANVATIASFGFSLASAQMADNATMGNMTGGNMTMGAGNMTMGEQMNESGSISSFGSKNMDKSSPGLG